MNRQKCEFDAGSVPKIGSRYALDPISASLLRPAASSAKRQKLPSKKAFREDAALHPQELPRIQAGKSVSQAQWPVIPHFDSSSHLSVILITNNRNFRLLRFGWQANQNTRGAI
jgi:hypothetical protein